MVNVLYTETTTYWKVKTHKIKGTSPKEIIDKAKDYSSVIESSTKRLAYVKSRYFKKEKVFLKYFWEHFYQSSGWKQRSKRAAFFLCAIELIEKSAFAPVLVTKNRNKKSETLYRFAGLTTDKEVFFVQIKEYSKGQKYFMSVFGK